MNRRNIFLSVVFFLVFFSGCKKNDNTVTEEETLVVSPSSIGFGKDTESESFSITSNTQWTVSKSDDWLSVTPESGEGNRNVTVSVIANSGTDVRTGTVTVTTKGGIDKLVQVTQSGIEPFINIDPDAETVETAGRDVTVTVTASGSWTAQIPDNVDWVTLKSTQGTSPAVFTVAVNASSEERSAAIIFMLDGVAKQTTFNLTQNANLVPEWVDITNSLLQNTTKPFSTGTVVANSGLPVNRYFEADDWTTNTAAKTNGNVDTDAARGSCLCFWVWPGAGCPLMTITNGKLYQTVRLAAGKYKFDVYSDGSYSNGYSVYIVVALGNDLPDVDEAENAKGFAKVPDGVTAGTILSVEFDLTEESDVSLGFVGNLTDRQQVYFQKIEMWAFR